MCRFFVLFILILGNNFTAIAAAPSVFDFNANCIKAYKQIMALQNNSADSLLIVEKHNNPNNIIPVYLADYQDCLQLLFNGDINDYNRLKTNTDIRLNTIDNADKLSPWYLFCKANIHLHWALVHLHFGDNFKAATKFRKSFLLLQENKKNFPKFEENNVLLGLEEAMAGAIPENYKWLGNILGLKGNINKGVADIVSYLNAHQDGNAAMHEEAMVYYIYLKFYLQSEQQNAWKFLNSALYPHANNLLRSFIKANIALNYRKADTALNILAKAATIKQYSQYPILHYETAEAKILLLDLTATQQYTLFINTYKGKHFIKDAWLKRAYIAYLNNSPQQTNEAITNIKTQGNTHTDADKQALRFAENPNWPLPSLLQIRLLIDGGNYALALTKIKAIDKKTLSALSNILEYNFRYGRIFEELGQHAQALQFYTATIQYGRQETDYYAARAALHKGFIYERQGNKRAAITQFKDCLSMRHHDFQSSIDQLAKAGLNRLQ